MQLVVIHLRAFLGACLGQENEEFELGQENEEFESELELETPPNLAELDFFSVKEIAINSLGFLVGEILAYEAEGNDIFIYALDSYEKYETKAVTLQEMHNKLSLNYGEAAMDTWMEGDIFIDYQGEEVEVLFDFISVKLFPVKNEKDAKALAMEMVKSRESSGERGDSFDVEEEEGEEKLRTSNHRISHNTTPLRAKKLDKTKGPGETGVQLSWLWTPFWLLSF